MAGRADYLDEREWLAALGHELRNSVNCVLLGLQAVERALPIEPARARGQLELTRRGAAVLGRLIDDYLEATMVGLPGFDVAPRALDLTTFLPSAVAASGLPSRDHAVRYTLEPESQASVDPDRLQQIVTNLLSNAVKYSSPGLLTFGAARRGEQVVVSLQDEGPGLEEHELTRVFERFSHAPSRARGLGVGLWLSREIARRMGGDLWATSPNGTSVFHLALPAALS